MRDSIAVALVLLMVGSGHAAVRAQQSDDGWWTWAAPLVTGGSGRIAVPRPPEGTGEAGPRERPPQPGRDDRTTRAEPSGRETAAGPGRGQGNGRGRGGARVEAGGRGRGVPAFCRTGAGHPVFGWQWCAERGFDRYRPRWERETWADRVPPWPRAPREGRVETGRLGTILGDGVFGRLRTHAAALGATEPLDARWVRPASGALALQVRAGDLPIAEFSDTTADGRVDTVIVNRTRREP